MRLSAVALHEAGHCIGAEIMGMTTLSASIVPAGTMAGFVQYEHAGLTSGLGVAALRNRAYANGVVALCGACAEAEHTREPLASVLRRDFDDLWQARHEASLLALTLENWHPDARVEVFQAFLAAAQDLVREHWKLIATLAERLRLNPRLNGADVARVVALADRKAA
jgi:hypothetical protein